MIIPLGNNKIIKYEKRILYGTGTFVIILAGLSSRKYGDYLPRFVAAYAGDILWAAMVYLGIRFLFPGYQQQKTALASLLFSYGIEFSQLYQAEWINTIRHQTVGALILGQGFLWSDLVCYTLGVGGIFLIDKILMVK
ncbi:MAG: DUF2809 domain-containing protein [Tannerellaceae bacterium]|nr:DUF2809 domain-containing protein [Tannerellaceae bacterium]